MKQSNGLYVLALTQWIVASVMVRQWLLTSDGGDLLLVVIAAALAIVVSVIGYKARHSPAPATSDSQVLRRMARIGGAAGAVALIALLWRVQGEWPRLVELSNVVLALACIVGFVCAAFGGLFLKQQRVP